MITKIEILIADKIHTNALEIYKIYNQVVRTPVNWREERERLIVSPNSRPKWKYKVPNDIEDKRKDIQILYESFKKNLTYGDNTNLYVRFLPDVVEATVNTAIVKCEILLALKDSTFEPTLQLRKKFYDLDYDYQSVKKLYSELLDQINIQKIGKEIGLQTTPANEAAEIVKKSIVEVRKKIQNTIFLPPSLRKKVMSAFNAQVEVVEDPSFSMRCITDPKTLTTKILLNARRKYSKPLLKIAYLHEFCGHALEMALFDKTLVKNGVLPMVFNYAGVSSPSIFDVKSEVFADLIVSPFVEKKELKYVRYRRDVWLICRAMADYLYNIKGKTIKDVMEVYENVGLGNFAFDEAVMASIFIDGYQGMYLFANQEIDKLQRQNNLSDRDVLSLLLYIGKVPISKFETRYSVKDFLKRLPNIF